MIVCAWDVLRKNRNIMFSCTSDTLIWSSCFFYCNIWEKIIFWGFWSSFWILSLFIWNVNRLGFSYCWRGIKNIISTFANLTISSGIVIIKWIKLRWICRRPVRNIFFIFAKFFLLKYIKVFNFRILIGCLFLDLILNRHLFIHWTFVQLR